MLTYQLIFLFSITLALVIYFFNYEEKNQDIKKEKTKPLEKNNRNSTEKALAVMSEVDTAILSNAGFEQVVELILPRLSDIFSCALVAITQLNKELAEESNTNIFLTKESNTRCQITLDKLTKRELNNKPKGLLIDHLDQHSSLKLFSDFGVNNLLALPIYVESNLVAVLYFGFSEKNQYSQDIQQLGLDFAGRLGVVFTSAVNAKRLFDKKHFDELTGLPNRRYISERFSLEISRANRYKSKIGILYIKLDGFKKINEISGYAAGDNILKQVATRLSSYLRVTDLVARFSSDEFVVILPEVLNEIGVSKVAEKLIHEISEVYFQGANQFYLNCRIGISTYPSDGQTVDALLSKADSAMSTSKVGHFAFHTEKVNTAITNQLSLERDLRKGLEREEFFVVYQPQIDLRTGEVVGLEALVRWKHPIKGDLSPIEFLAIAEETDLINQLGRYVRKDVFNQYREWKKIGIAPKRIAINISSKELLHHSFMVDFESLLQEYDMDPSSVEIEITESLLVDMTELVNDSLARLRYLNVHVAIDDFGTGYSSLSYLTQLPFDVLKLDRAFVAEIGKSIDKVEIVSLIIDMAHHLKKKVCAEGVESIEQLEFLRSRGCETAQGYFISRPIAAEDFEGFRFELNANREMNAA